MSVLRIAWLGATIIGLMACSQQTPGPYSRFEGMPPDATVTMDEVQAACIGNAGGGSGTLLYRGVAYPFTVAGLGVGGIGASTLDAIGDAYNLPRPCGRNPSHAFLTGSRIGFCSSLRDRHQGAGHADGNDGARLVDRAGSV